MILGVLVCPGEIRESPRPPLENENLDPEGDGDLNEESPPPPLLNENFDLDGETKGVGRALITKQALKNDKVNTIWLRWLWNCGAGGK